MYSTLKRIFVGRPIPSSEEHHQRLSKVIALAVFASDAISSTAYATEEILLVLVPVAGMAALNHLVPLSLIVVVLLAIVTTSYRQTLFAYPSGGGSYIVSRENLGITPALVAGGSLLVDYVLTVAVSVSAGVAAITSAFPSTQGLRVPMCIFFVALMTVGNLRGVKESGRLFAGPTYVYVFALELAHPRRALPLVLREPRRPARQPGGARSGHARTARCSQASRSSRCSAPSHLVLSRSRV